MKSIYKSRKVVYVPNNFCNFGCSYCYLGRDTDKKNENLSNITANLKKILDDMLENGVVAEQIVLHGAEVTTIPRKFLSELLDYISDYFQKYKVIIKHVSDERKLPVIHTKTNLYNYDKYRDLFIKHKVNVSASVDIPLILQSKYRKLKSGKESTEKVLENIKTLKEDFPNAVISSTLTKEVLNHKEEFVKDIKYLNDEIGFDMVNNFYIMFAYDSVASKKKFGSKRTDDVNQLSQEEMVDFYEYLKKEFDGTDYMTGIQYGWFREFLTGYCTATQNCGHKFMLIQHNGDTYPCHRAQPDQDFKYGNIYEDGYKKIDENGPLVISKEENKIGMESDCLHCDYFHYCRMGCSLVRKETKEDKAYTCKLQLAIYKDNPQRFPPMKSEARVNIDGFIRENKRFMYDQFSKDIPRVSAFEPELVDEKNSLSNIVLNDPKLAPIYEKGAYQIVLDNDVIPLHSPLVPCDDVNVYTLNKDTKIDLFIKKNLFTFIKPSDEVANSLFVQFLRDTHITYGDEKRTKQEHIYHKEIFPNIIKKNSEDINGYYKFNINHIFDEFSDEFLPDVMNNFFFTTRFARDYHYKKQSVNAFYHIQAMNLPFHNFMFFWEK